MTCPWEGCSQQEALGSAQGLSPPSSELARGRPLLSAGCSPRGSWVPAPVLPQSSLHAGGTVASRGILFGILSLSSHPLALPAVSHSHQETVPVLLLVLCPAEKSLVSRSR